MSRLRVLLPDSASTRAADWSGVDVDIVYYDPADPSPDVADPAEVLVAGASPHEAVRVLARELPNLRVLQTLYAGVEIWDHVLRPEVQIVNASGAFGRVTAEIATAGLLALQRRLPELLASSARSEWTPVMGESTWGKRVLVIGAGDVGTHVRLQLEALGAEVVMAARTARDGVLGMEDVPSILAEFDVVVIAAPLNAATQGLVDADFLGRMADGAILVNVGRGRIVDTDALLAELQEERLRAVLDVTEPEPLPSSHPLWEAPGLILTPHVGGMIERGMREAMTVAVQQIGELAHGHTPSNLVPRDLVPER